MVFVGAAGGTGGCVAAGGGGGRVPFPFLFFLFAFVGLGWAKTKQLHVFKYIPTYIYVIHIIHICGMGSVEWRAENTRGTKVKVCVCGNMHE
jgi:hypothetical protein